MKKIKEKKQMKNDVVAVSRHRNGVYIDGQMTKAAFKGKSYTTGSNIPQKEIGG